MSGSQVDELTRRIQNLLQEKDPSKLGSVPGWLHRYEGKEWELYGQLCKKYGVKPHPKPVPPVRRQIKEIYSIGEKLGVGGFAVVRRCKRRVDSQFFALKVINKKNLDPEDLVILDTEVNIMKQVKHENIVKLHDVFDSRTKMCLVLDLLEGGELFDRIIEKGHFTEADASKSFQQMVSALHYLHQKNIVHRDLKPENLLFATRSDNSAIKLIDFGLAGQCNEKPCSTPCGTPNYVAPEILKRRTYGTQVDMWSIGVILYIILCGFPPFYDENDNLNVLYGKIKRAEYEMPSPFWDEISDSAKDLVRKLLVADPNVRLTAAQTLAHPWLAQGAAPAVPMNPNYVRGLKRFQYIERLKRGVRCVLAVCKLINTLQAQAEMKTS